MPRGPRRARCTLFRSQPERADFLRRLADLAGAAAPQVMRSLLSGSAGAFHRRPQRTGRLWQKRYKAVGAGEVGRET